MTKAKKAKKGIPSSSGGETIPVAIKESSETWSVITLEDGTLLRIRPVIVEVERAMGKFTEDGSPVYMIKSGMIIDTKSPDKLKRK